MRWPKHVLLLSLLATSLVISKAPPPLPPEGYEVVVGYTFPFGGIYIELAVWAIDCLNDVVQVSTFIVNHDYFFAAICGLAIGFTVLFQTMILNVRQPWREAFRSVRRGVITASWHYFLLVERGVEGAVTGLVAPYGMALRGNLDFISMTSAMLGVVFSAKAMAACLVQGHCDEEPDNPGMVAAVSALVPKWYKILTIWALFVHFGEISLLALSCAILHPLLVLPGFSFNLVANLWTAEDRCIAFTGTCLSPIILMTGAHHGWCGLQPTSPEARFGKPTWVLCATVARYAMWIVLSCALHLPHGVLPYGHLNREMGAPVFWNDYFLPTRDVVASMSPCFQSAFAYVVSMGDSDLKCAVPHSNTVSAPSNLFRSFLFLLAVVAIPINLVGSLLCLICIPGYRECKEDHEFRRKAQEKRQEIIAWGDVMENDQQTFAMLSMTNDQ